MASSSAYYATELSYLKQAQTTLHMSGCLIKKTSDAVGGGSGAGKFRLEIRNDTDCAVNAKCNPAQPLTDCASNLADPLLRFNSAWERKANIYRRRRNVSNAVRNSFGDLDTGVMPIGWVPFSLIFVSVVVCYFMVVKPFMDKRKASKKSGIPMDVINVLAYGVIYTIVIAIVLLVLMMLSWTLGVNANYTRKQLEASLMFDMDDGGLSKHPSFSRIRMATRTVALRQIYNCSQGLPLNANLDDEDGAGQCVRGRPPGNAPDAETLRIGINELANVDLVDFDAVQILRNIYRGIAYLRNALAPLAPERKAMSIKDMRSIVINDIVPVFKNDRYKVCGKVTADNMTAMQSLFASSVDPMIDRLYDVIIKYWPHLAINLFMEDIDRELRTFYACESADKFAVKSSTKSVYYDDYLKDYVVGVIQVSSTKVSDALKNTGRYASLESFRRYNWARLMARRAEVQSRAASLFINISRYMKNFTYPEVEKKSVKLLTMYINMTTGIIVLGFVLFLVWFVCIKNLDILRAKSSSVLHESKLSVYLNIFKIALAGATLTLFVTILLRTIKTKAIARSEHNINTTDYNTKRLQAAAWGLLRAVRNVDCSNANICKDREEAIICDKGGGTMPADPNVGDGDMSGPPDICAQPDASENSSIDDNKTKKQSEPSAYAFYTRALAVMSAYEKCNLITKSDRVPFPVVEFILFAFFVIMAIIGLAYINALVTPVATARDLRNMLSLRDKISLVAGGSLPENLLLELKNRVMCSAFGGGNTTEIMTLVLVILAFLINFYIITELTASSRDYELSLQSLSADTCV